MLQVELAEDPSTVERRSMGSRAHSRATWSRHIRLQQVDQEQIHPPPKKVNMMLHQCLLVLCSLGSELSL